MNCIRHIVIFIFLGMLGATAQTIDPEISSRGDTNTSNTSHPDTLYMTSEDLIDISLSQSPDLELANIQYAIASLQYQRFATFLKPSLNINGQIPILNRAINVINLPDGQEEFVNQSTMRNRLGASLDYQLASTGGRIFVASSIERLDVFRTEQFPYSKSYFFTPVTIGIEQPLFQFNSIKWQKEILERQEDQTDARRVLEQESVVYAVVSGFYDLELIRRRMELTQSKIADSRSLIRIKEQLFERGRGSLAEMKQLALDTLQSDMEYQAIELEYAALNRQLLDLVGLEPQYHLVPVSTAEIYLPEVDLQTAIYQAIHHRARTSGIRLRMAESNRDIEEAEKDRGVSFHVSASLGLNNTAETFSGLQYNFLDRELLSIGFNMPITDWGRRQINRQLANIQLEELEKNLAQEERQITRQVTELHRRYQYLKAKRHVDETALQTAGDIYESVRNQYLRGQTDWVGLQQSRLSLDNATLTYYQTRSEAVKIYYQLRSITLYDFERNEELIYHENY